MAAASEPKPQLILSVDTSTGVPTLTAPQTVNTATASRSAPGRRVESSPGARDEQAFVDEFGFQLRDEAQICVVLRYVRSIDGEQLRRREAKWEAMTQNWTRTDANMWEKMKERARKGIPPRVRGIAWQLMLGSRAKLSEHAGVYQQLLRKLPDEDTRGLIERDLARTFPSHALFRDADGVGQQTLRNILHAYNALDPEVGYCLAKDDMELLTDTGFVDYAEARRRYFSATLVVAGYNQDAGQIVYERPYDFIDNDGAPEDGMYEVTPERGNHAVSLRVTGKHRLLCHTGAGCVKLTVDDVLSGDVPGPLRLVGHARHGAGPADSALRDALLTEILAPLADADGVLPPTTPTSCSSR
jgi:hypothetical protein